MKPTRLQDDGVCFLCDWWWLLLLLLFLIAGIFLSQPYWGPMVFPPTLTPRPTATMIPTNTIIPPTPIFTTAPTPTPIRQLTSTVIPGTGDVQVTLLWQGHNDLDLHVVDPQGEEIYFSNHTSNSGGELDIDSNAACGSQMSDSPIENIYWGTDSAPKGDFRVSVHYYVQCTSTIPTRFTVRLLVDGVLREFEGTVEHVGQNVVVIEFQR